MVCLLGTYTYIAHEILQAKSGRINPAQNLSPVCAKKTGTDQIKLLFSDSMQSGWSIRHSIRFSLSLRRGFLQRKLNSSTFTSSHT